MAMRFSRREYRKKAFDCLSQASGMRDPHERADMLGLAQMWMSLAEPMSDMAGHFEFPKPFPDNSDQQPHIPERR
jgi:hypothetical protein